MAKQSNPHPELTLLHRSLTVYPDSPDRARLEAFHNAFPQRPYQIRFDCPEFTSLCPITGQPDFGTLTIEYIPAKLCLESKALKLYLFSFRNHPAFHEEVVNRILEDLVKLLTPRYLKVIGNFNPRGGIALNVTAEYPDQPTALGNTSSSKKLRA
jgi:7-cyano-7-deazaguanine reductase